MRGTGVDFSAALLTTVLFGFGCFILGHMVGDSTGVASQVHDCLVFNKFEHKGDVYTCTKEGQQ